MYACPKGHSSTAADFCSECGAKIAGVGIAQSTTATSSTAPTATASISFEYCPECSTPHEADSGNFCEICGYNFVTRAKGGDPRSIFPPPVNVPPRAATMPTQRPVRLTNPPSVPLASGRWQAIVSIDPSLASPDSPAAPDLPPKTIDLTHSTNLIGRTSQARAIHPEIPLDIDDAVSSRHAILTIHPDRGLVLRDIGSSNGTSVNGREITIMADVPIAPGDEITLGHWTRIKLITLD